MIQGRSAELSAIDRLIARAQAGDGGALQLAGEPGIGKSALLAHARERAAAHGLRVAAARGVESEARLPFAALGDLAAPLLDGLDTLPGAQAGALATALALAPAEGAARGPDAAGDAAPGDAAPLEDAAGDAAPGGRLAVFAGFRALLAAAADDAGLVLLVDDAHWLDGSSAECLGYAARRLAGTRVALLAAARPAGDARLDAAAPAGEAPRVGDRLEGWGERLALDPLAEAPARALLAAAPQPLSERAVGAVLAAAAGNPLALKELPGLLTDRQRDGEDPVDPLRLQAEGALADALRQRVAGLDEAARAALLAAAASADGDAAAIVAACRSRGGDAGAVERLEAAGLLRHDGARLTFAHPLMRGVVYHDAAPSARRELHRALAEHTLSDQRAWHLAAAALGADAEAAAALDLAAARATARGAHETAADALDRAAQLSAAPAERAPRLLAAGLASAMGGDFRRGAGLLERVGASDVPALRGPAQHLLAMVTLTGGLRDPRESHAALVAEAERVAAHDGGAAAAMLADAAVIAVVAAELALALSTAERARETLPPDAPPTARCQALSILGMAQALRGRAAAARRPLDEAGALLASVDPLSPAAQSISFALGARLCTGQETKLRREARDLAAAAAASRSVGLLPYFELQAADSAFRLGDLDAARPACERAVSMAEVSRQSGPLSIALAVAARIGALRGEEAAARAQGSRGAQLAAAVGYRSPEIWSRAALGFLELGAGRVEAAVGQLEQVAALARLAGLEDPSIVPWEPDLLEAYARAGRAADAARCARRLAAQAERADTPLARALAARAEGVVARDGFAEPFERALACHEQAGLPFERARTLLAYGARLHRAPDRRRARERLREALAVFEQLGARPWAARARAELRAAGAVERPVYDEPDRLTGQERRVAVAVAGGATNREAAARLDLSPKTVEYHLGRVYRKLGIRSRTELAARVAAGLLDD